MNRALIKGRYLVPADKFEKLDSLCNRFHYYLEPNDMPVHRIIDKKGTRKTSDMILEFDDVNTRYLLTILHVRHETDDCRASIGLNFAESLYVHGVAEYIGSL